MYRPGQAVRFPEVEAPRFQGSPYMKVVRLSALRTGLLYPLDNIPGTHFCYRLSRPEEHSSTGRIMTLKISSDTIGIRIRDLPASYVLHTGRKYGV
jgi:hypothetical protein